MKILAVYLVSQVLIALNAVVCLSWMFGLTIQHWGGLFAYVTGFMAIATAYNYVIRWERLRESEPVKLGPIVFTVNSGSLVSVAAVDPDAGVSSE